MITWIMNFNLCSYCFVTLFYLHRSRCLSLDVSASQNPSMLTMALRRVSRPDDVSRLHCFCSVFSLIVEISVHYLTVIFMQDMPGGA